MKRHMKRIAAFVMATAMITVMGRYSIYAQTGDTADENEKIMYGDTNNDKEIDVTDESHHSADSFQK